MPFRLKRIYESPSRDDGVRVPIDRLWPRGFTRDAARIDLWLKEAAPPHELRKWFAHEESKWAELVQRYEAELAGRGDAAEKLRAMGAEGTVTLVFATAAQHHHGVGLLKVLERSVVDRGGFEPP